jgi:predicted cobalt transporter CbtA
MVRALLVRGLWVGLVAGLLVLGFAYLFGEASIDRAIDFEEQAARAAGEHHGADLVSRSVQSTIGLATATVVYGVAFGGIFALVFAAVSGRIADLGPRATAALLGLAGFVSVSLVPFLKYPANPPAANNPASINERTALYVAMVIISVAVTIAAIALAQRLAPRFGVWDATLLSAAAFILIIAGVQLVLPTVNETPADFPASVLYQFRLASLGSQAVLWSTLGLLFGWLTERSLPQARSAKAQTLTPATAAGSAHPAAARA